MLRKSPNNQQSSKKADPAKILLKGPNQPSLPPSPHSQNTSLPIIPPLIGTCRIAQDGVEEPERASYPRSNGYAYANQRREELHENENGDVVVLFRCYIRYPVVDKCELDFHTWG
jgi:hypothetical protein